MKIRIVAYWAKDAEALRQGSFYRKIQVSKTSVFYSHWIKGDYMGQVKVSEVPDSLEQFTRQQARKLLPGYFAMR